MKSTLVAIAWTLVILVLCWTPRRHLPIRESGPSILPRIHADKIVHGIMFAGFGLLWLRASGRGSIPVIVVSGIALAVITELGQATPIVGRDADVWDGAADVCGLVIGLSLGAVRHGGRREGGAQAEPG